MAKTISRLIVASSETSADLRHATKFNVSDPVIFLDQGGKKSLVLNDLEIDRGKRQAEVDEIVALSDLNKKLAPDGPEPDFHQAILGFLKLRKIKEVEVHADFPYGLAKFLAEAGLILKPKTGLLYPAREFKTAEELKLMRRALKITETGMSRGIEVLRASEISRNGTLRWAGKTLTSERLRAEIDCAVLHAGGLPANTIVAGGVQACDPHERGSGPLKADQLIVIDIFPKDAESGYFGDLTRTVVRGTASDAQRKLWEMVLEGQKLAFSKMKPGVSGDELHQEIKTLFTHNGYPTELKNGRWSGFFHGTGHGLGMEIHETPRFSKTVFRPGQVITVEPGLYYEEIGGVRHEDVVTITETGIKLLSSLPKPFEI